MLMFGNWYSDLLSTAMHVSKQIDDTMFDNYVEKMRAYEEDLKTTMWMSLKSGSTCRGNHYKNGWMIWSRAKCIGINCTVWIGAIKTI